MSYKCSATFLLICSELVNINFQTVVFGTNTQRILQVKRLCNVSVFVRETMAYALKCSKTPVATNVL